METPEQIIKLPSEHQARSAPGTTPARVHAAALAAILLAALGAAALLLWIPPLGKLLAVGLAGLTAGVIAFRWPVLPLIALWLVAPFNYGIAFGGAVHKLTDLVVLGMIAVGAARLVAGDADAWARARRHGVALGWLGVVAALAVATAVPHPNVFNVRYEIFVFAALAYGLLFFQPGHWRWLLGATALALVAESLAALVLKFVFDLTGTSFFLAGGGVATIQYSQEALEAIAGGRFRLSGTMGHKNLLGAFYVLLLPLVGMEAMRRFHVGWLAVLAPSLAVLALTDSMTAWGAIVVVVAVGALHFRRFDFWLALGLAVLPVATFGIFFFGESILFRIHQLFYSTQGWATVSSRGEILEIALRLLREHAWFGIGRNNFLHYGHTFYGHAHNFYLMKMLEMGIPGGLALIAFFVVAMARTWGALLARARELAARHVYYRLLGLWLGALGFLTMNVFDYNYGDFALGPMFGAIVGIMLATVDNRGDSNDVQDHGRIMAGSFTR